MAPTHLEADGGTLETERLLLRRLVPADVGALYSVTGNPAVMRYWHPGLDPDLAATAVRSAEIELHWCEHQFGDFGVVARESGALIGFAGSHHIAGMSEVDLGYALLPSSWRSGLGTELTAALLAHGLSGLGLPEVVAVIDPRNAASIALAARSGLTLRGETTWQGQTRLVFALTKGEFEAGR